MWLRFAFNFVLLWFCVFHSTGVQAAGIPIQLPALRLDTSFFTIQDTIVICGPTDTIAVSDWTTTNGLWQDTTLIRENSYLLKADLPTNGLTSLVFCDTSSMPASCDTLYLLTIGDSPFTPDLPDATICSGDKISFSPTHAELLDKVYFDVYINEQLQGTVNGSSSNLEYQFFEGMNTVEFRWTEEAFGACFLSWVDQIEVAPLPEVSLEGIPTAICSADFPFTISGFPAGGLFWGEGIDESGNVSYIGPGTKSISYGYTSPDGCTKSISRTYQVYETPDVSFSGLSPFYCENDDLSEVRLIGLPLGGAFSGVNLKELDASNTVSIALTTFGESLPVTYTYTSEQGCTAQAIQSYNAFEVTPVSILNLDSEYCYSEDTVQLEAQPMGGLFLGDYVSNDGALSLARPGNDLSITYRYVDENQCRNQIERNFTIHPLPELEIAGIKEEYCATDSLVIITGLPAGGVFTGDIDPDYSNFSSARFTLEVRGEKQINYSYTSPEGCLNTTQVSTRVYGVPGSFEIQSSQAGFSPQDSVITLSTTFDNEDDIFELIWSNGATGTETTIFFPGFYTLSVQERGSTCVTRDTIEIDFLTALSNTPSMEQLLNVYPNPFKDNIQIAYDGQQPVTLDVYNMAGARFRTLQLAPGESVTVPLAALPSGTYFLKARNRRWWHQLIKVQ